ncbi:hypothetical protein AXG93_1862s1060 [Marchantia polymorpha subsp. ruderalis]|uniref:Uncharacterized protein n=1 Tax=Marchantia polymorpha subsp. ruderalis TaxID=1480154 RepID=A0A176W820_MARPO|nr:hypothetical protein AXG93_1862s1060 [Marchantia polymorpha subsp. ruderalis]
MSNEVYEPEDYLDLMGQEPFECDSGQGMTYSGIAGISITDLNLNKEYPLAEVYSPSRCLPLSPDLLQSVGEEVSQTVQTEPRHRKTSPKLTTMRFRELALSPWGFEDMGMCSGAVIQKGLKKVAVDEDERACVHQFSAIHLPTYESRREVVKPIDGSMVRLPCSWLHF